MTYMPVDGKPDRVHVGARALDLDDWIEINQDYEAYVAYKLELLSTKHDEVFVSLPMGDHGSREVLALISEHLPRIFPQRWPNGVSVDESRHPLEAASLLVQEDLCLMTQVFPQRWPTGVTVDESRHPLEAASLLVQEDLCLMTQVGTDWILSAASLCFPSRWDVRDKIGKNLLGIHAPVPHYEEKIGTATQNLFDKLTVERPIWRVNWTVMDSGELHQPTAPRGPEALQVSSENIEQALHFRRERQTLRKLPESGDILFTILTFTDPFATVVEQFPEFRRNIGTTIAGASPQTGEYKGWVKILNDLQAWSQA